MVPLILYKVARCDWPVLVGVPTVIVSDF